jgi:hypothetical protein
MIPTSGLADYIIGLARQHGVNYERTPDDAIADVMLLALMKSVGLRMQ